MTANPNAVTSTEPDVFVYTITDGDGDLSTTTLTINVDQRDDDGIRHRCAGQRGGAARHRAALPLTDSEIFNGAITPSGGTGPYTYTLTSTANGDYGNLVLNPNGTYTYTLDTPYDTRRTPTTAPTPSRTRTASATR